MKNPRTCRTGKVSLSAEKAKSINKHGHARAHRAYLCPHCRT